MSSPFTRLSPALRQLVRQRRRVAVVAALLGVASWLEVSGAVKQWTDGAGTSSWGDAANWTPSGIPLASDALLFGDPGTSLPLALDGSFAAGSLSFDSSHDITLDANTASAGSRNLTLTGGTNALGGTERIALSSTMTSTVTLGQADGHGFLNLTLPNLTLAVPNAAATLVLGANSALRSNSSVTKIGAGTLFVNGVFTAGVLSQAGGTLVLSAPTSHRGFTEITGGTLLVAHPQALQLSRVTPAPGLQFAPGLGTATFGALSGGNDLILEDTAGAPIELQVAYYIGNSTYGGVLSGPGGLTRLGPVDPLLPTSLGSSLTLSRPNTYTGATTVSGALAAPDVLRQPGSGSSTLLLNFSGQGAPLDNIISASSPLVFGGAALSGGGALQIYGSGARSQTFASTTVREGASFLVLTPATGATLSATLGPLTRTGGTLDTTLAGSVTASGTLDHGILGGWATISTATFGIGDSLYWATLSNGRLVAYFGETRVTGNIPGNSTVNYTALGGAALSFGANGSTTDLNALRCDPITSGNKPITVTAASDAGTLRFGATGGILSPVGSLTIGSAVGNGRLTAGGADNAPGELFVVTSSSGDVLTVNSRLVDNGTGAVKLSKTGGGTLVLNDENNTYSGGTVVDQGFVSVGAAGAFGHNSTGTGGGDVRIKAGGMVLLAGGTWDNRFSISGTGTNSHPYSNRGALWLSGATLTGEIGLVTNASISSSGTVSSVVSGVVSGGGALLSNTVYSGQVPTIFTNSSNNFTGGVGVTGNSMIVFAAAGALSNDTQRNVLMSSGTIGLTFPGVQDVLNRRFAASNVGTIALAPGNASENIDLSAAGANLPNLSLGAYGIVTYIGTYTPYAGVYRLGGGLGTFTYPGDIAGASKVVIGGSGTSITTFLSGHNTYSGGTSFNGGVASFAKLDDFGAGPLSFGGGTLLFANGNTTDLSARATTFASTAILDLGANNVSFANSIGGGGPGGLTKLGSGTLTLNAPAGYSGTTSITAGTLNANVPGALPVGGSVVLSGLSVIPGEASVLNLGADQSVGAFSTNAVGAGPASQILLNGHRLTFGSGSITAVIRGIGQLRKIGSGSLDLYNGIGSNGTTDYVGPATLEGGTLNLVYDFGSYNSASPSILPPSNPLLLAGGTLSVTNRSISPVTQEFEQIAINPGANGLATVLSTSTATLASGVLRRTAGGTLDVSVSAGSSVTTKTANTAGTILGGWATFGSNQFAVSAGDGVNAGAISGLASGNGSFANGGDVEAAGTGNVAAVAINSLRFNTAAAAAVDARAGLSINSGGLLLTVTQSANVVSINQGTVTSGNGADLIVIGASSTALTINSKITGAIGLTKSGAGAVTISNVANDFSGAVTLNGGTLQVPANGVLGNNSITINGNAGTTSQLVLGSGVALSNAISLNGQNAPATQGSITALGPATLNGPITIASEAPTIAGGVFAGSLSVNAPIFAPAGFVVSSRAGAVVLAGGGNYTNYTVMADTTSLGADNGMSTTAVLDAGTSATAALDLNGFRQTLAGLTKTGSSIGTVTNSAATPSVLTLDVPTGRALGASIVLAGNLSVVKNGAGSQTLTFLTQSYIGSTTINAGTLAIDGSTVSDVAVNVGGTLQGTGAVAALTVANGGTVAPGEGAGMLRSGSFQLATGAHLALELATPDVSDVLSVAGTVSLAGDFQLTLLSNFTGNLGDKFFVILNDGTDLVDGATATTVKTISDAAGHVFAVNYADNGDGGAVPNDVSLTVMAVPEPSTAALLAGAGWLAGRRRSRRRSAK